MHIVNKVLDVGRRGLPTLTIMLTSTSTAHFSAGDVSVDYIVEKQRPKATEPVQFQTDLVLLIVFSECFQIVFVLKSRLERC